jgi:hypothetical protein
MQGGIIAAARRLRISPWPVLRAGPRPPDPDPAVRPTGKSASGFRIFAFSARNPQLIADGTKQKIAFANEWIIHQTEDGFAIP